VLNGDGSAARGGDLVDYAQRHGLRLLSIADLVAHRRRSERLIERVANVRMPTTRGEFQAVAFRELLTQEQHVALVKGTISADAPVLVRVHTQCLLGDVFHSRTCDCGEQLTAAADRIEAEGEGILLYLSRPNRGVGLLWRLAAAEAGSTHPIARGANEPTDVRDYGIGSQMLVDLGARQIRVLTDNARDLGGLEAFGLTVVEQVPLQGRPATERREHHQRLSLDDPIGS
jgi:3,4-dihydroxy 2-butanone 4-phosphate synthase/GTP cyclohydrolase II